MAKGDHIYVVRRGGLYSHHGIDCGDNRIIHFNGDNFLASSIHETTPEKFARDDEILVRDYTEFYAKSENPGKPKLGDFAGNFYALMDKARGLRTEAGQLDTSPDAVVARAESRLGETGFNLGLNNCEHFATWCKTGTSNSKQVEAIWKRALGPSEYFMRRASSLLSDKLDPANKR